MQLLRNLSMCLLSSNEFKYKNCAQVYTLTQQAMSIVTAFPYVAENPYMFDILAAERGELAARDLMKPAGLDSIEHNARWQQIVRYLGKIRAEDAEVRVPIVGAQF